jgi:small subunit ribosomal protein S17
MSNTTEDPMGDSPAATPTADPQTADATAAATAGTATAGGAVRPNARKVREGVVASTSMDKTIVVSIVDRVRHPRYAKTVQRTKRLYVHDQANDARPGDRVRVQETRPLSKLKRWRLVEILERAR